MTRGIQLNKAMDDQEGGLRAGLIRCANCGAPATRVKRAAFHSALWHSAPCNGDFNAAILNGVAAFSFSE